MKFIVADVSELTGNLTGRQASIYRVGPKNRTVFERW